MREPDHAGRRCALVTGSSRGIGRGVALGLAAAGFDIVVNGLHNSPQGRETARTCGQLGVNALFVPGDVASSEARHRIVETVRQEFGRLDILVNNAGIAPRERCDLLDSSEESFDRVVSTNLKGPYFLSQLVASWMIGEKAEHPEREMLLINVSSISAYTASPDRGEYCVSKAGLSMMTKLFAVRLAAHGINVYEIRPGIIDTDMTTAVRHKYTDLIEAGLHPIRRWGNPEDIARAVVALAQGALPFSTGEVVNVDGGFHLRTL